MGKLKYLVIHCADTPPNMVVTGNMIRDWHTTPKPKGRGWDRVGYSDLIHRDGTIENLTPYDEDSEVEAHEITWGSTGVNSIARHVCLAGGKGKFGLDTLSDEQFVALERYVRKFVNAHPDAKIAGHNHFAPKPCPNFYVDEFCNLIGIPVQNILAYETRKY